MTFTQIYWMTAALGFIGGIAAASIFYGWRLRRASSFVDDMLVAMRKMETINAGYKLLVSEAADQVQNLAKRNAQLADQALKREYPAVDLDPMLEEHIDSALSLVGAVTTADVVSHMTNDEIVTGLWPDGHEPSLHSQYHCSRCSTGDHPGRDTTGLCVCCSTPL